MPTLRTVTVKSSGGDYTSLSAAIAGEAGNLVTLDRQLDIICDAILDTTRVSILAASYTTDATRYIRIAAASGQSHGGVAGAGYRLNALADFQKLLYITTAFVRLEGLSIKHTSTTGNTSSGDAVIAFDPGTPTAELQVNECLVTGGPQQGVYVFSGVIKARNSAAYGTALTPWLIDDAGGNSLTTLLYNCVGIASSGTVAAVQKAGNGTTLLKNCYGHSAGGAAYLQSLGTITKTTCASSDATGSAGLTSVAHSTVTFNNVTSGSENYRLVSGSALIDTGTNLSADANYAFSGDFIGTTRTAPWDVGVANFLTVALASPSRRRRKISANDWTAKGWFEPGTNNAAWFSRELVMPVSAGGTTVALTGVAATDNVGAVAPAVDKALTGNAGTGAVGAVTAAPSKALTGNAATGVLGSVSQAVDKALTSAVGTGAVGVLAPAVDKAITGNSAPGAVGSVTSNTAPALTGNAAAGAVGAVGVSVVIGLTGVAATGDVGTVTVQGAAGAALTGVAGTGAVGTVTPSIDKALTSTIGTGSVGAVGPAASGALTGAAAAGAVGSVGVNVTVGLTGVAATGAVGTVSVAGGDVTLALTGVSAIGAVGDIGISGDASPTPAGGWDDKPRKRKHRWLVEIAGVTYEVASEKDALDLIAKMDEAEPALPEKPKPSKNKLKARIISKPKVQIDTPAIDSRITEQIQRRIDAWNATVEAVVRHAAEMDDEESLLVLL